MNGKYRIETLEYTDGTKCYIPKRQITFFWGLIKRWVCFFDEYDCDEEFDTYEKAEEFLKNRMGEWRLVEVKEFTTEQA